MRQLNLAYLMKLGWRMETEPNILWARVLRAKYYKGRSVDTRTTRHRSISNAWRGIIETLDLIKKGLGYVVWDGGYTKFWSHKWIDGMILANQASQEIPKDHKHRVVCDYWSHDTGVIGTNSHTTYSVQSFSVWCLLIWFVKK